MPIGHHRVLQHQLERRATVRYLLIAIQVLICILSSNMITGQYHSVKGNVTDTATDNL